MKRKTLYIISLILFISLTGFLFVMEAKRPERKGGSYSSLKSDLLQLAEGREYDPSLYTDLYFNGVPLMADRAGRRLYYCVNNSDFDPEVSYHSGRLKVAVEDKDISEESMAAGERSRIVIYDDRRYAVYELVCTDLPLMNIRIADEDFSVLYSKARFTVIDNSGGEVTLNEYTGKVRIRGGSTASIPKPGLRIELRKRTDGDNDPSGRQYELFGLEPDNEFFLYTSNVDKTMLRNVFSMNLWYQSCAEDNSFGIKAGTSYRYTEVFLNGSYWGLCALGNSLGENRNLVDLDPFSKNHSIENIYKANFYGSRKNLALPKDGDQLAFFLKTNADDPKAWKYLDDFLKLLLESEDRQALYDSVDLDNAIDIYLFYDLIQGWDNSWTDHEGKLKFRNTFLISKVDGEGKVRMVYMPWDLDRTWGFASNQRDRDMIASRNYQMGVNPVEDLIRLGDDQICGLVYRKYRELRSDRWSDERIGAILNGLIDDAYYSGAVLRDKERWPFLKHKDDLNPEDFTDYVFRRIEYFDGYIEGRFNAQEQPE